MKPYKDICKACKQEKWINNARRLCFECVYKVNHGGKNCLEVQREKQKNKPVKVYTLKRTPLKRYSFKKKRHYIKSSKETQEKRKETLRKDRETYFKVFINKENFCEECGCCLPSIFEDENGNIVAIYRFSHILSKGSAPEFRHNSDNFNIFCLKCHNQWDFGEKEKMNIFEENQKIIEKLRNCGK